MKKLLAFLLALCLVLSCAAALADEGVDLSALDKQELDYDGDGIVDVITYSDELGLPVLIETYDENGLMGSFVYCRMTEDLPEGIDHAIAVLSYDAENALIDYSVQLYRVLNHMEYLVYQADFDAEDNLMGAIRVLCNEDGSDAYEVGLDAENNVWYYFDYTANDGAGEYVFDIDPENLPFTAEDLAVDLGETTIEAIIAAIK